MRRMIGVQVVPAAPAGLLALLAWPGTYAAQVTKIVID